MAFPQGVDVDNKEMRPRWNVGRNVRVPDSSSNVKVVVERAALGDCSCAARTEGAYALSACVDASEVEPLGVKFAHDLNRATERGESLRDQVGGVVLNCDATVEGASLCRAVVWVAKRASGHESLPGRSEGRAKSVPSVACHRSLGRADSCLRAPRLWAFAVSAHQVFCHPDTQQYIQQFQIGQRNRGLGVSLRLN